MPAGMPTLFQHGATNTPHSSNSIGDWSSNENSTGAWCPAKSCVVQGSESEIHQTSIMVQVATRLWEARWHVAIFFIKMARFVSWRLRDIVCQFLMKQKCLFICHSNTCSIGTSFYFMWCVCMLWVILLVFNNACNFGFCLVLILWMACDANQQCIIHTQQGVTLSWWQEIWLWGLNMYMILWQSTIQIYSYYIQVCIAYDEDHAEA